MDEELTGLVEKIVYRDEMSGFTVASVKPEGRQQLATIIGSLSTVQAGERIQARGSWSRNPNYGLQFKVEQWSVERPTEASAIQNFLQSGLIKGVGPVFAKKIVDTFGTDSLNILDTKPERLLEIEGIGPKKLEGIILGWAQQRSIRDLIIFLQKFSISPGFAHRLFKIYGQEAISRIQENPYRLARDIPNVGFKTADALAQKMGMATDAPARLDAAVEYALSQAADQGHVCYPRVAFAEMTAKLVEVASEQIDQRLQVLNEEGRIVISTLPDQEGEWVWLKGLYLAERGIGRELKRLRQAPPLPIEIAKDELEEVQEILRLRLAPEQIEAIHLALQEPVAVVTGGPGTGKSTLTRALLSLARRHLSPICLGAPTGRAAKRLSQVTGMYASTLHSLLEYDPITRLFKRDRANPLNCKLLIIDEASMIDTSLMYSLLKAVPSGCRLLCIGDVDQLPSVGPGCVLRDLINWGGLPVVRLSHIYRQGHGSQIVWNAHRINQGLAPSMEHKRKSDFFFLEATEPEEIARLVVDLVAERLPKAYGFDPMKQIQVLAPMRRGALGIEALNVMFQERLNPKPESQAIHCLGRRFAIGDKVMQLRNNYDKEIFNGDVGRLESIDPEAQQVTVNFDDRGVTYDWNDLDELVLAYTVSVHKYQGSEAPCIVMPIHTSHYMLLQRNLLYTAVTRGKKLVVLVGSQKALMMAVNRQDSMQRHTGLIAACADSK
jgi:exodeoxyribonuclease V alpha subunit